MFIQHNTERIFIYYQTIESIAKLTCSKTACLYHLDKNIGMVNTIAQYGCPPHLVQDYNIYVFHGTDGDDWDTEGKDSIPELKKMLTYANRVGITIAQSSIGSGAKTEVEKYIRKSGMLTEKSELLRLDVMEDTADEPRLIEGIKNLIS